MAASQEQKVDFLLKKIGYVASKTGIAEDESSLSGTKKAPFGEAIPSPLVVPSTSVWADSSFIPTTPPGSSTGYVEVYLSGTSGHRMTVDSTVSGNRTFIAHSTYNNTSSAILGDWIDTSFSADYIIKVYKGDPNSGGVQLSAAGSGSNDTWFFDYSSGVLNFNGTQVPSGVTSSNIYIVGYRYIGTKGIQFPAGVTTATSLSVSGISTFTGLVDANGGVTANTLIVEDLTNNRVVIAGSGGELEDDANFTFDGAGLVVGANLNVSGVSTFQSNVNLGDSDRLRFGGSQDLQIYHDGSHSYINDTGTGNLKILSTRLVIKDAADTEVMIAAEQNSSVDLYFNGNKRLETNAGGVEVTGIASATTLSTGAVGTGINIGVSSITGPAEIIIDPATVGANTGTVRIAGDLQVDGTTVTLDTVVTEVDRLEVSANNTTVGAAITQTGSGDILNLYDGSTEVFSVEDGGRIVATATNSVIPFLYAQYSDLPSPSTYHGAFAHVHATGKAYFAHAGNWIEIVSKETSGTVGTGTETYSVGAATFAGDVSIADKIIHTGDTNTAIRFPAADTFTVETAGTERLRIDSSGRIGINRTPSQKLDILNGSDANVIVMVRGADATSEYAGMGVNEGNAIITGGSAGSHNVGIVFRTAASGAEAEKVRITSAGSVGIGTDNPALRAHIFSTANADAALIESTQNFATLRFKSATNTSGPTIGINGAGGLELDQKDTSKYISFAIVSERLRILNDGKVRVPDNGKFVAGAGDDLQIYHTGSHSNINHVGTGNLQIRTEVDDGDIIIQSDDGSGGTTQYFRADGSEGESVLYHYGNEKIATKSFGIDVTGEVECDSLDVDGVVDITGEVTLHANLDLQDDDKIMLGTGTDLRLYHNGTNSYIENYTGNLFIFNASNDRDIHLQTDDGSGGTADYIFCDGSTGAVVLSHYGNTKLATTATGINVTGTTDTDNLIISGTVSAGSSTGNDGQYLISTGVGVSWTTLPTARTTSTQTAIEDQTSFNFNYNVGFVDVFYNGVKLANTEFTATNGTSVVLNDVAYAGDLVEFVSYNTAASGGGGGGGASSLNELSDVTITGTPVVGETLTHNGTKFVNDYTATTTTTATTQTSILSLDLSVYRSVEYQIQVTEGSKYHTTKILAIHNGTAASHNEFGTLSIGTVPATFDVDISGSNLRLLATPASSNSTVFKVKFTAIKV